MEMLQEDLQRPAAKSKTLTLTPEQHRQEWDHQRRRYYLERDLRRVLDHPFFDDLSACTKAEVLCELENGGEYDSDGGEDWA